MYQEDTAALYGIDWNAPLNSDADVEAVQVPATVNPLTSSDYTELQHVIDPTANSDDHGIDQFFHAVRFVESKVSNYQ